MNGAFTVVFTRPELSRLALGDHVTDLVRLLPSRYQERIWETTAILTEGTAR